MFMPRGRYVPKLQLHSKLFGFARGLAIHTREPLRVLFCGADEFSIKSLEALHREHDADRGFIGSIDVVCRPPKRTGRGLKILRHAPIKATAQRFDLTVHEIDTFKGWKPPSQRGGPPNLIVAVSFGLFIPKRILSAAPFGGVNVHPSLLPEFRGPAPIQHAILKDRQETGVTVQTLNDEKFDHGQILAQTMCERSLPDPSYLDGQAGLMYKTLAERLADVGAATLVETLRSDPFPPSPGGAPSQYHLSGHDIQRLTTPQSWPREPFKSHPEEAPKITTADRHLDWAKLDWRSMCLRHGALGQLWDETTYAQCHPQRENRRIIYQELAPLDVETATLDADGQQGERRPGHLELYLKGSSSRYLRYSPESHQATRGTALPTNLVVGITTCDPNVPFVHVRRCTLDGGASGVGQEELTRLLMATAALPGGGDSPK